MRSLKKRGPHVLDDLMTSYFPYSIFKSYSSIRLSSCKCVINCVQCSVFGSLSKIMENSLRNISSCKKPTDAILSRIVDLNALYQHPFLPAMSRAGFAVLGRRRFLTPNISLTLGNFLKKFFTALYLSTTSTTFPFL